MFKKIKNELLFILLLHIAGIAYAASSPSDTIFRYYEALNNSEYSKGYEFLSSDRKKTITEEKYVNYHVSSPHKEVYAQLIEYRLIEEKEADNTATVKLALKHPSFGVILPILMSASHLAINTLQGKEELLKFVKQQLNTLSKKETIPYEEREITVKMIKENDGWKLDK